LLYFLKTKNINLDEDSFEFEIEDLVKLWVQSRKSKDTKSNNQNVWNIFG
jgi:hypothetical protein